MPTNSKRKPPVPAPVQFQIRHNLAPGERLVLTPAAVLDLVRLLGRDALLRAVEVKRGSDE